MSRAKAAGGGTSRPRPHGKKRAKHEVHNIQVQVETLMLYNVSGPEIRRALAQNGVEVSERSLDDYSRRIRDQWAADAAAARATARERQLSRLYGQVRALQRDGKHHGEVREREKLIAKIEGNLAPLKLEVVEKSSWDDLTPEQLDYMAKNGGKLPPGVTAEQLRTKG